MPKIIDLIGQNFGILTVVEFVGRKNCHSWFRCKCKCGGQTVTTSNNLRRNHTTSCGCNSSRNTIGVRTSTHKLRNHPLYNSWTGMINRCYWSKHNRSKSYSEKGIVMCDEWKSSFEVFYEWATKNGWEKGLSIDRINNDGNYEPLNCKFSTNKQQSRNRSSNVWLEIDGISKIAIEWSEEYGVHPATIHKRIKKGWSAKEAVFGRVN